MRLPKLPSLLIILTLLAVSLRPGSASLANPPKNGEFSGRADASAYDLIAAMNTVRVSNGLPALVEDPIINAVAQGTAETMAANLMSWHVGDVRGRLAAAGYGGGGGTVFATENFAMGYTLNIDEIMVLWADPDHMRPAATPAYCSIGAGVAEASNGMVYYVLQAAYVAGAACGSYTSTSSGSSSSSSSGKSSIGWGIIVPVKVAEPDDDGRTFHIVESGQSLWAIAVAYHVTIQDLETYNNISRSTPLRVKQKLFIPNNNTAGYATPTPVGMIVPATPGADGKTIHTVAPYQALITIAAAYDVSVDTILKLNNIQADWPLQIGQKLVISAGNITPSPTPRPLTPIERLTPAADGLYYHTVSSGENLSWIANLYGVSANDLMSWNGLYSADIRPNQKLLLKVTPPATATYTPGPPTATPTATQTLPPPTATMTLQPSLTPTPVQVEEIKASIFATPWPYLAGAVVAFSLMGVGAYLRRKQGP